MRRWMRAFPVVALIVVTFGLAGAESTERVSVSSAGEEGDGDSGPYSGPSLSAAGRYVAFQSYANNLVAGDTNSVRDIFVHDRLTGATERVSVSSTGGQGNDESYQSALDAAGRYVAFGSGATNLIESDTNWVWDVFVHDRQTGVTERVSVSSAGDEGNGDSEGAALSADGRYVVFESLAGNLVVDDTNAAWDIFLHDRESGATERVSISSSGGQGNSNSNFFSVSTDGRYVAFSSASRNLVENDTNDCMDVFVRDRESGATERVSVSSTGEQGNQDSQDPWFSADGRYVGFRSWASNLVADDTNGCPDIFVHDRETGVTERASVSSSGEQGDGDSWHCTLSADGRYVAFHSLAGNLVAGDTNEYADVFLRDRLPTATPSPSGTATATLTATATETPVMTQTLTPTPTGTPTLSSTATMTQTVVLTPTPSATETPEVTPTATLTASNTATATPTTAPVLLTLQMPGSAFGEGDPVSLDLVVSNSGSARTLDLYVLLDAFGQYFAYPSWSPVAGSVDHQAVAVPATSVVTWNLIPEFTMPTVSPAGPFYFYAAMFESGTLSLETLASNGAAYEFWLQ